MAESQPDHDGNSGEGLYEYLSRPTSHETLLDEYCTDFSRQLGAALMIGAAHSLSH
jgi:hypothetical protein